MTPESVDSAKVFVHAAFDRLKVTTAAVPAIFADTLVLEPYCERELT